MEIHYRVWMDPLIIIGAGGSGRELAALVDLDGYAGEFGFVGLAADDPPDPELLELCSGKYVGSVSQALNDFPVGTNFLVGIGDGSIRRKITMDLEASGWIPVELVSSTARIGDGVCIGPGVVICDMAVVTTNVVIGRGTQINVSCTISHDTTLGAFVTLAPGVNIPGNVHIGDEVTLFTNATLAPGIIVGKGAVVGAGAVVIRDVEPGTTVVGNPARAV